MLSKKLGQGIGGLGHGNSNLPLKVILKPYKNPGYKLSRAIIILY